MQVIIAGGGTGGHVFPALAVAEEFAGRDIKAVFVGTKTGLEAVKIPTEGFAIEFVYAGKWKGQNFIKKIFNFMLMSLSIFKALRLISKYHPDVVIGVGGYVSVPMLIAAVIRRIPVVLMEQNSIPGIVNRIMGRYAKKVCVTFPESASFFKPGKALFTGNPVRKECLKSSKEYPASNERFVVLCFGGSQGAKTLNESILASLRYLMDVRDRLNIIHIIGSKMDIEVVKDIYKHEGFYAQVYSFVDNPFGLFEKAHVAICRAGAGSLSELMIMDKPAILVPFPYAADNHQESNARYVEKNGGAVVFLNSELNGEVIAKTIKDFIEHPEKLLEMAAAMRKMAKPAAAKEIVDECIKLTA